VVPRHAPQAHASTPASSSARIRSAGTRRLHAEGATVILLDRDGKLLKPAVAELGNRCETVTCDVADHAGIAAVIGDASARHGRLDVLVTAAGVDDASFITGAVLPVDAGWTAA
jgi:NADP-dependent 3-hydroxy acid dehydrogenase YdfG